MSSWKMIVSFEELQEIAGDISRISGHLHNMAESYGGQVICGVKSAWGGKNADAFIAKEVKHINRLYEAGADLSEIAGQLKEKAEQIYALEKGNVATAQTRIY